MERRAERLWAGPADCRLLLSACWAYFCIDTSYVISPDNDISFNVIRFIVPHQ